MYGKGEVVIGSGLQSQPTYLLRYIAIKLARPVAPDREVKHVDRHARTNAHTHTHTRKQSLIDESPPHGTHPKAI